MSRVDMTRVEAARIPWRTLGELFVQRGLITNDQLEHALAEQASSERRLGEILVERGLVSAEDLRQALMDQLGVEISEEGLASSLWAEIKRRHESAHSEEGGPEDDEAPSPLPPAAHEVLESQPPALVALPSSEVEQAEPSPVAEPELEPVEAPAEPDRVSAGEISVLRAELAEARAEAEHLREMLADSMTALSALISESGSRYKASGGTDDAWHDS